MQCFTNCGVTHMAGDSASAMLMIGLVGLVAIAGLMLIVVFTSEHW
jgi:hypothetical protein